MRADLSEQISQLQQALERWDSFSGQLPAQVPVQNIRGIATSAFRDAITECIAMAEGVSQREDVDPLLYAQHQPGIASTANNLFAQVQQIAGNPGSMQQHAAPLMQALTGIRTNLLWLVPVQKARGAVALLRRRSITENAERLQALLDKAEPIAERLRNDEGRRREILDEAGDLAEKLKGYEREAANAKTNVAASAESAAQKSDNIEEELERLSQANEESETLIAQVREQVESVENAMEGVNRVGLARSFQERRKILERGQTRWVAALIATLAVMAGAAIIEIVYFTKAAAGGLNSHEVFIQLIRLPVLIPIIWAAWFFAREYGHSRRMAEDYAFKEAAAMAYQGYKEEFEEDDETIASLRGHAIENFGANPLRFLDKSEPSSPVHDLIVRILDKVPADKLLKSILSAGKE